MFAAAACFETFNDEGFVLGEPVKVLGTEFRLRQYSATIVPAFKMMAYETPYRVFENKNVEQIIDRGRGTAFRI